MKYIQLRIQDFPAWGTNLRDGGANLLFNTIFAKNYMKMKDIGQTWSGHASLTPPSPGSATDIHWLFLLLLKIDAFVFGLSL